MKLESQWTEPATMKAADLADCLNISVVITEGIGPAETAPIGQLGPKHTSALAPIYHIHHSMSALIQTTPQLMVLQCVCK